MRPVLFLAALAFSRLAYADESVSRSISGTGTLAYVGLGVALPFLRDGQDAKNHGWRTAEALGLAVAFSEGLKRAVRAPRPDTGTLNSFPSGHATAAFAVATMQAAWHPKEAPFWYAGAALIAYSRVDLNRHTVTDVVGGAALGFLVARWELSRPNGPMVTPLLFANGSYGLLVAKRF